MTPEEKARFEERVRQVDEHIRQRGLQTEYPFEQSDTEQLVEDVREYFIRVRQRTIVRPYRDNPGSNYRGTGRWVMFIQ